jgi:hypothetical protein
MAIIFNGGGDKANKGFEGYCFGMQWNDERLLRFRPAPQNYTLAGNNEWLHRFNTEAIIKGMLEKVPLASKGLGQHNTVRQWVVADEQKG